MRNTYAKIFSDLNYQNQVLKSVVFGLVAAMLLALSAILIVAYRGPIVIGLSENGDVLELSDQLTAHQIEAAIRHYVHLRYNWRKDSLGNQKLTEAMILENAIPAFRKTIQDLLKFSGTRSVEQRIFPRSIQVDQKAKTAFILADRVNVIESLKAATELKVVIKYTIGERTVANPWGVYIEKEAEGDAR